MGRCGWCRGVPDLHLQSKRHSMMNTYEATIRLPNGGYVKVTVEADNWNHAQQLLAMKYGADRVNNLHQKS